MQFRRQALRQLEAPEQLDQVVRLTTVPSWLLSGALAAIVAVAGIWAAVGTVDRTVRAAGVLIHANGVSSFDAAEAGQVVKIWASPNQLVGPSTPLYTVRAEEGIRTVTAPWDAYVLTLLISEGQLVQPGTPVAELERLNSAGDPLQAVVFVSATSAPVLRAGVPAQVAAAAVPSTVFGTLHGEITDVGAFPETEKSLHAFLGAGFDVGPLLRSGTVVRVVIALATDPDSPSGLRWSKAAPPFALNSESQVTATFIIARERPINWLVGR